MSKNIGINGLFLFWLLVISFSSCATIGYFSNPEAKKTTKSEYIASHPTRQEIVEYAKTFLGSRYRSAGRSPDTGFDCSGFTCYIMQYFGVSLSPSSQEQSTQGREIEMEEAQPGDLVFFRRKKDGRVFHVAMVTENSEDNGVHIIHSTSRGVVIDDLEASAYWSSKFSTVRNVLE